MPALSVKLSIPSGDGNRRADYTRGAFRVLNVMEAFAVALGRVCSICL